MAYPSPLPTCPLYHVFHQSINTIINCAAARRIQKQASAKFKWWEQSLQKFPSRLPLKTTLKYSKRALDPSCLELIPQAESCQPEHVPGSPLITEIPLSSNLKSFCYYLLVFTTRWVPRKPCLTCAMLLQVPEELGSPVWLFQDATGQMETRWGMWCGGSLLGLAQPCKRTKMFLLVSH